MCGVVATFGADARDEERAMRAALAAIAHRGPDGEGLAKLAGGRVWLGHRRLALVDVEGGAQPIANEDESIWAAVNGEIYDDARLRRELEARGHVFRSRSDSELLVHLYEEHGDACVEKVRGELAFVLFDAKRGRLLAGRDRFGIKPLVYAWHRGHLCVASEAKALFALGVPARWDLASLAHVVAHQYLPPSRTLFTEVQALPPGCLLVATLGQAPEVRRYHTLTIPEPRVVSAADAAEEVRAHLAEAVRLRLRSDVPVGAYLSGGLDSSAVLALAARQCSGLAAFGVAFEHAPYDEGLVATRTAESLGVPFEPVLVRQQELVEGLEEAVRVAEGLAINGQLVAKHRLAAAARAAGIGAVLTGEGADEAFLGYPHLRLDRFGAHVERASDAITRGVMIPRGGPTLPLDAVERRFGFVPTFFRAKAAFGARLATLLSRDLEAALREADPFVGLFTELDEELAPSTRRAPVEVSAWLWTRLALSGYIVRTLGDGTEMAHSLEGRPPFLDHVLFEHAWSLPVSLRLDASGREKAVLRDAVADLVPPEIATRPKQPFLAPPVLSHGDQHEAARELLLSVVSHVPFFDAPAVRRWLDELTTASVEERAAAEPVWTTITSAALLGKTLGLG